MDPVLHGATFTGTLTPDRGNSCTFSIAWFSDGTPPNFTPPNGNLESPYFGQPRGLGGLIVISHGGAPSAYNRKIDVQLRFAF